MVPLQEFSWFILWMHTVPGGNQPLDQADQLESWIHQNRWL